MVRKTLGGSNRVIALLCVCCHPRRRVSGVTHFDTSHGHCRTAQPQLGSLNTLNTLFLSHSLTFSLASLQQHSHSSSSTSSQYIFHQTQPSSIFLSIKQDGSPSPIPVHVQDKWPARGGGCLGLSPDIPSEHSAGVISRDQRRQQQRRRQ